MQAGDYIFTREDDSTYRVCRILHLDAQANAAHVSAFKALDKDPSGLPLDQLELTSMHLPIMASSFADWKVLAQHPLTRDDLAGYFEYLKYTDFTAYLKATDQNIDDFVQAAEAKDKEGEASHDRKDYLAAIEKYRESYEIWPLFYEGMVHEAICHISLKNYPAAIHCLENSTHIRGNTPFIDCMIGECFYMIRDDENARLWLNRVKEHKDVHPDDLHAADKYLAIMDAEASKR